MRIRLGKALRSHTFLPTLTFEPAFTIGDESGAP